MLDFLNAFPWNPVTAALRRTRETILVEMERQGVTIDLARLTDVNLLKRHVLKRCIYGVDLNPMAVELAKVSLWLDCFTLGAPLSFLDHHLKYGNSLIGIWDIEKYIVPGSERWNDVLRTIAAIVEVSKLTDSTAAEARESHRLFKESQEWILPTKDRLNVELATQFTNLGNIGRASQVAYMSKDQRAELEQETLHKFKRSQEVAQEKRFFHWKLEFPEVFFGPSKASAQQVTAKENPGFDAVVGNPPYDVLAERERKEDLSYLNGYILNQAVFTPAIGNKLDLYRLFVVRNVALGRKDGYLGQIIPMSLLGDQQAMPLRKYLLESQRIISIEAFPQKDDPERRIFREAKLPTCVIIVMCTPDSMHEFFVRIHPGKLLEEVNGHYLALPSDVEAFDSESSVIPLVENQIAFHLAKRFSTDKRLVKFGKLAQTFQGEINETTMADLLSENPEDGPKILRGSNIQRYEFLDDAKQGLNKYLLLEKYKKKIRGERSTHYKMSRYGYQRNAALDNWRRLIFGPLPIPCHCFDSVSYLLNKDITSNFYLAVLNSSLQEWRFRLTSSNNHVSTDEISNLPMRLISFTTPPERREAMTEKGRKLYARCLQENSYDCVLGFVNHHLSLQPEESDVVHDLLAFLAEQMIEMNKQKQAEEKRFLAWLENALVIRPDGKGQTGLEVLTGKTKLQGYLGDYQKGEAPLSFEELEDVLHKNRTRLGVSLNDARFRARLKAEYEQSLEVLRPLKERLARTDGLIDRVVYRLYDLTEEEIAVVEGRK